MNFKKKSSKKLLFFVEKIDFEKIFRKKIEETIFQTRKSKISIGKSFKIDFWKIDFKWLFNWKHIFFSEHIFFLDFFFQNIFSNLIFSTKKRVFSMIFFLKFIYSTSAFQRTRSQLPTPQTTGTGTMYVSENPDFRGFWDLRRFLQSSLQMARFLVIGCVSSRSGVLHENTICLTTEIFTPHHQKYTTNEKSRPYCWRNNRDNSKHTRVITSQYTSTQPIW